MEETVRQEQGEQDDAVRAAGVGAAPRGRPGRHGGLPLQGLLFAVLLLLRASDLGLAATATAPAPRWFEDRTAAAGLAHPHGKRVFKNPYAAIMGGYTALGAAAAVADYDGDGFEDLFVTDSAEGGKNHLYHNDYGKTGDLTFTDVAEAAGVANGNDGENASADALFFDDNNDGRPDLFVVRFGHSQLFENLGNGRFKEVTKAAGLDRYANAIAAIAFDYDHDGRLDLLVGNYFQPVNLFHPDTPRFFPESFETANNGGGVTLYHNDGPDRTGQVTFSDATVKAGLKLSGWTLAVGHGDADGDGDDDLYVACDFGTDRFFLNNGDGTFTDRTEKATGIDTKKGMNAEWGDFDGDLRLDVFVTNITDDYMREGNFLWHNNGPGPDGQVTFTDVAKETGVWETGWGWAGKFFDYDNDGWLDLYVTNGWVSAGPESYVPDIFALIVKPDVDLKDARNWPPMGDKSLSGYEKKRLFHNLGGEGGQHFKDEAARHGLDSVRDGRGIAVADFDNDGRMDLFVANAGAEPYLYHNILPLSPGGPHWLELVLTGKRSNRDAVGAQVRLTAGGRTLLRFVDGGNGFAGQSTKRLHFGLGGNTAIDKIEVLWPSGLRQTLGPVAPDHIYRLTEGESALKSFTAEVHKR
jgi:ASPIC/UnbV protein/VCBS repeat protein